MYYMWTDRASEIEANLLTLSPLDVSFYLENSIPNYVIAAS